MVDTEPDFGGWASKANLKCSDGRTINTDAFKHQDQAKVPLVWQHGHNEPANVLGYAVLENRPEGVYCKGYFNSSPAGENAKTLVVHNDISALSIYANKLVEKDRNVVHGMIREVSLVLAGANPGAFIDFVNVQHSDGSLSELEDEAIISTMLPLEHSDDDDDQSDEDETSEEDTQSNEDEKEIDVPVAHADKAEKTVQDVFDTLNEEQKNVVYYMLGEALKSKTAKHSDDDELSHAQKQTVKEIFESLDEDQQNVVHYMIGEALAQAAEDDDDDEDDEDDDDDDSAAHSDTRIANSAASAVNQEGNHMKHNLFENGASATGSDTKASLSHDDLKTILSNADKRKSTFNTELAAFVADSDTLAHGVDNLDVLFPDARAITTAPEFLARRSEWVADIMTGTRHTPFSRIKSLVANLTFEAARAKGYIKGTFKKEEFIRVSKRVTTPTTVYKKQKLDRDDILDITDFDVVAWLKGEMRLMLEEEVARAVLIGDGRLVEDEDKISEENIRPIATDSDFYVTYLNVDLGSTPASAEALIDALVLNRRHYRGSGNPTLFTSETVLARLLLIKDTQGRRIYATDQDLKAALRVSKIVTVELLDEPASDILGIMVNLADYTIGADRGGDVAMFDDFDIDFNQQKYLIETRLSGALTKAKSAIVIKRVAAGTNLRVPTTPTWNPTTHVVTIPTVTGITYRNRLTNAPLTGTVALQEDQELQIIATPTSATDYLASTAADEFLFSYEDGYNAGVIL